MNYLLTLALCVLYLAPASAQKPGEPLDAISNYFSEYVDDQRFTAVYVSGKVFELFGEANIDIDEIEEEEVAAILEMVKDIRGIRILHTDERPLEFYREAKRRIPTDAYELLFKVRTKDGQNVEGFIQNQEAIINEFFMLVGADDNFAMLSFVGQIDLSKLSRLQRALND